MTDERLTELVVMYARTDALLSKYKEQMRRTILEELERREGYFTSGDGVTCWYTEHDTQKFDTARFKEEQPELYQQYIKPIAHSVHLHTSVSNAKADAVFGEYNISE